MVFADTEDEAYAAARQLLVDDVLPTAIFAGHDALAIALLRAVSDAGLTSEVSIVGYDDIELAGHTAISLTTVDQFGSAMGVAATELLMERLSGGRSEPRHIELTPELRIRGSTRPPYRPAG